MLRLGIISTVPVLVKSMPFTMLAMTICIDSIQLVPLAMMEFGTNLHLQFDLTTHGLVLAQQFQNVDILGNIQNGWTDFLKTGKAASFVVGLVLGYMIRGITR
jgi:hypothetical protein